ncbi:unnamed protein product [Brassicogethes aeneus]|uniref:Transient receptor ion channel domain-containing protein n=1 Tax=Brassicogethes aeneus TaxID=1431903 RepID=A0A9P0B9Q4_BRAAE|nr:unnamed protein product [Brassicogethes aeneus]
MKGTISRQKLISDSADDVDPKRNLEDPIDRPLSQIEKTFLLSAERGDCPTVKRILERYKASPEEFDINCVDPLNRSALVSAIENENIDLLKLLLEENILVKDALLHAIKEEYVEAVEVLLLWEEEHHNSGEPYSWERVDRSSSAFTADITPLILAAHKNNYEIIKILLDRGATLPIPHDVRCGCDECVHSNSQDSLRHSQSRINAYRALTSPSLIALSSSDPLLTAFELSRDLRRLSRLETEFRAEYNEMRAIVQDFATALVDHSRTSYELEVILNYDPDGEMWHPGERQTLERLKLAIKYNQKQFIAHPSVQQLLAAIWYEGLPGFRRKSMMAQLLSVAKLGMMFPVYCSIYMIAPKSQMGLFMKKPFVKFICHSMSYAFFLTLLGAASQRIEILALELFGTDWVQDMVKEWQRKERGAFFGIAECGVILYVISLVWAEIRALWNDGLEEYISDLWNIVDFITNMFYVIWFALRTAAWFLAWYEEKFRGGDPWYPREMWDSFEPMLISEGAFAAGMIFSFLKLVHIFSVNPHLGPLQISLGRMIIDIVKFFFIYSLVLFAFGCGMNQLLWYYAELEKNKCYVLPNGLPDFDNNDKACTIWRRYANLFETSQSLFWASFGLVDLVSFELTGIKGFTRFWALLMFGSYSVINIIVLLNMLIAMMSNSYQIISERSDTEWKFARSRLWISYFDDGDTLPPPFNIMPAPKLFLRTIGVHRKIESTQSFKERSRLTVKQRHEDIMKLLVRRYVTAEQRKRDDFGVTEDDVMEIRQDISSLRFELINILHTNGMKTPQVNLSDVNVSGKKGKEMERRILKDFHIGIVENLFSDIKLGQVEPKNVFGQIAKAIGKRKTTKKKDWNALVKKGSLKSDPIGTKQEAENQVMRRQSLRGHILTNVTTPVNLEDDKLLEYNPKLSEVPRGARVAYAKFMTKKLQVDFAKDVEIEGGTTEEVKDDQKDSAKLEKKASQDSVRKLNNLADAAKRESVKKQDQVVVNVESKEEVSLMDAKIEEPEPKKESLTDQDFDKDDSKVEGDGFSYRVLEESTSSEPHSQCLSPVMETDDSKSEDRQSPIPQDEIPIMSPSPTDDHSIDIEPPPQEDQRPSFIASGTSKLSGQKRTGWI